MFQMIRSGQFGRGGKPGKGLSSSLQRAFQRWLNQASVGKLLSASIGNESWVGSGHYGSTGVMSEWQTFVKNQLRLGGHGIPAPKLVCIDIQPYGSTQAPERTDILNIGGFSDAVFHVVASYLSGDAARFVAEVEAVEL
jgi:60 kDa SS-A/Ro ribonucleoprotein